MRPTALIALGLFVATTTVVATQHRDPRSAESPDVELKMVVNRELVDGDLAAAVERYQAIATRYRTAAPSVAAKAMIQMAASYEKLGRSGSLHAKRAYEEVVRNFPQERGAVAIAHARLGGAAQTTAVASVTLRSVKPGDISGTVSPDGRYLSSTEYDDGNLHVRDLRTGADRVLTRRKGFDIGLSVISPDSSQVVYQVWGDGCSEQPGGLPALCVVALNGDGIPAPRTLFESADVLDIAPMDWSSDGRLIAVSLHRRDRSAQIGVVAVADGSLSVIQSVEWRGPTRVVFSPDGRDVAFDLSVGDTGERRDIFVRSTDGKAGHTAVEHDSQNIVMDWAPDGSALLFSSNRSGTMDLWAQSFHDRRAQGAPRLLRGSLGGAWSLGMTTTGSLYFGVRRSERDIAVTSLDPATGKEVGPPIRPNQRYVGTTATPDWSPDGKYLAYISQRGFNPTNNVGRIVCVQTLSTGVVIDLHPKLTYFNHLVWKPDSTAILTSGTDLMGRSGVFSIDARTGDVSLIVQGPAGCPTCGINMYPKWSPDGKRVFYRKIDPDAYFTNVTIVERDLASHTERAVATGALGIFSVAPDGQSIAAVSGGLSSGTGTQALVQIRVATGETREILRAASKERIPVWTGLPWTPDGLGVLVRKRTPNELWLVPMVGDSPRKLDLDVSGWSFGPIGVISLSPDGRRIASTTGGVNAEVMVLENFLPARQEIAATLATKRVLDEGWAWDRISPDGRFIARVDNTTSNLILHELVTGRTRPLTADGNPEDPDFRHPLASTFSRDGRQLAHQWYLGKTDHSVLRVVDTGGDAPKTPRTLHDGADVDLAPTDWSPDGKWIAVVIDRKDHTRQIGIVEVADGSLHVLKTVDWSRVGGLRFSPDSSRLAYHRLPRDGTFERDVFVIDVDGSRETAITTSPGDDFVLEWTPGGRLLIVSDRGGSNSVWSITASDQTPTSAELVKSDIGIISSIGPTRNGTLFYSTLPATPGIYTAKYDATSGQLSSVQALQQFKGFAFFPEFSDDGSLAYSSRRDIPASINVTNNVLTILSQDTGLSRDVRPALSYSNFARWFPDGRHFLVYGADLKGRSGLFEIDAATGGVVRTFPGANGIPVLSRDGRSFFNYSFENTQLTQVDVSTGAVLRTLPVATQPYAASPDGRYVVTSGLTVLSLETGASRDLFKLLPPSSDVNRSLTFDFTPDSKHVVFYGRLGGVDGMWRLPIDGGVPQKIPVDVGPIFSWRFNAKTGLVAFSTNASQRLELWKMENFLPTSRR